MTFTVIPSAATSAAKVLDQASNAARKVLELPAYKAEYTKDHLTPMLLGREDARKFIQEVAQETANDFKEMGLLK